MEFKVTNEKAKILPGKVHLVFKSAVYQGNYGQYGLGQDGCYSDLQVTLTIQEANDLIALLSKNVVEAQR